MIKNIHEKQMEDIQNDYRKTRSKMEAKLIDLKESNNSLEFNLQEAINQLDKLKLKYDHKWQEEEYIKSKYALKYKELEEKYENTIKSLKEELGKKDIKFKFYSLKLNYCIVEKEQNLSKEEIK